jgi:hypothetical protein
LYTVQVRISFSSAGSAGTNCSVNLFQNGTQLYTGTYARVSGDDTRIWLTEDVQFTAGETVKVQVYQGSGSSSNISRSSIADWASVLNLNWLHA